MGGAPDTKVSTALATRRCQSYLVDESKTQTQIIGDSCGTLCAAGVRADDNRIPEAGDLTFNVPLQERLAVKVVDWNVKESLVSLAS